MKIKFPYITILPLLGLVVFDALQEKYFMETFNLSSEPILISSLIPSHLIRWGIWSLFAIPLGWLATKILKSAPEKIPSSLLLKLVLATILSVVLSVSFVSLLSLLIEQPKLLLANFTDLYIFFTFKKSLVFLFAYGLEVLLIHRSISSELLNDQVAIIRSLKKNEVKLTSAMSATNSQPLQLEIKIGNKIKFVGIENIVWIQADDYCVKIHLANDESYTLRKSLKALELQLVPFHFVRIHRAALLNLDYLVHINSSTSTVSLKNSDEIPASKTGLKSLRSKVKI